MDTFDTPTHICVRYLDPTPDAVTMPLSIPLLNGQTTPAEIVYQDHDGHLIVAEVRVPRTLTEEQLKHVFGVTWRTADEPCCAYPHPILQQWQTPDVTIRMQSPITTPQQSTHTLLDLDARQTSRLRPPPSARDSVTLRINPEDLEGLETEMPAHPHINATLDWYSYRTLRLIRLMTNDPLDDPGYAYAEFLFLVRTAVLPFLMQDIAPPTFRWARAHAIQDWALAHHRPLTDIATWHDAMTTAHARPDCVVEIERPASPVGTARRRFAVPLSHDPVAGLIDAVAVTSTDARGALVRRDLLWIHPLWHASEQLPQCLDRLSAELDTEGPIPIEEGPIQPFIPCADESCHGLRIPALPGAAPSCEHSLEVEEQAWHFPRRGGLTARTRRRQSRRRARH